MRFNLPGFYDALHRLMTLTKRFPAASSCAAPANLKMLAGIVSWLRLPIYQVGGYFVLSFVLFRIVSSFRAG
jgi:hypothetical protein